MAKGLESLVRKLTFTLTFEPHRFELWVHLMQFKKSSAVLYMYFFTIKSIF